MTKTIFITGASSGIGYQAAIRMLNSGNRLIIPCRNENRINQTIERLKTDTDKLIDIDELTTFLLMDLSDLDSVTRCISSLNLRNEPIDCIALNAGIQYTGAKKPKWSSQGIELTFAINHLSHQYLFQGLEPLLLKSKTPRVVVTSSEVHNPNSPGGKVGQPAGLCDLKGLKADGRFEMIDGKSAFSADKAYKDSKLCNILFARYVHFLLSDKKVDIPVICWAPGLVIPYSNEGFFRYSRNYNIIGQILFAFVARDILRITESPSNAGELLYELIISEDYSSAGFSYISNNLIRPSLFKLEQKNTSEEALDIEKARLLWELTEKLLKI